MKPKLLYVEDEADLGNVTKQYLETMNFEVTWCTTGKSAYQEYLTHHTAYSLIIIDIQLPDINGFDLARKIVAHDKNAFFLFLTARKEKTDRLLGLDMGAIDYITKPFDIDELVLRIRNITRRMLPTTDQKPAETIRIGDITLNKEKLSLTIEGNTATTLTLREAELLEYLYEHRNSIVKREDLLIRFWGENDYFMGRSLDVFISRLRKLLRRSSSGARIENIYGVGFILSIP
ncbi:response regulator transcription factor [Parapedobacter sp. ISTM3]|uniref:DNA-binding response regulator, OmpR family, contains REC and winged-helix (WHTH) domain n=1 Tax=Parapedobacter luteus TaxID=623280 RepID=A0A1T5CEK5_9SPHI|nr:MULTISPECIES: response regulator transcription factor [Parapedobacter]MBK1438990.1 response regulator transcription factor [Parapedobacter sp. ISTM3]SKB57771.1 DNA-binding response regulator, OmpR family, contains REC and winged-helix (wHTH) domain [Parapedobacter luteus]